MKFPFIKKSNSSAFDAALASVLKHEGGYVNDPVDRGGETKFGISKRSYPKLDIQNLTLAQATDIYRRDWWDKYDYANLPAPIAIKVFDLAVNMGARSAHRILQRALKACGQDVAADGIIGAQTLQAAKTANPEILLAAMRSEAAGHYRLIINRNPAMAKYRRGWLKRAYS